MSGSNTTVEGVSDTTSSLESVPTCPCDPADCQLPVDLILRSSDGCKVGAHMKNLSTFSEGFPSPDDVTKEEPRISGTIESPPIVNLEEDGETLRTLILFMHKVLYPRLSNMTAEQVFKLAAAAEKYLVYPAISTCNVYIEARVEEYPLESMVYGAKFSYWDIVDKAARKTILRSVEDVAKATGEKSSVLLAWLRYRESFILAGECLVTEPDRYINSKRKVHWCADWMPYFTATVKEFPASIQGRLALILNLPQTLGEQDADIFWEGTECDLPEFSLHTEQLNGCKGCGGRVLEWKRRFARLVSQAPKLSSFLKG